jgi:hypothetical protein
MSDTANDNKEPFRGPRRLFDRGRIVATPGALAGCAPNYMRQCLARHLGGDWGCVCAEDRKSNFEALFSGGRILSAYPIDPSRPCKGFRGQHAVDHHRRRPQRDDVPVAERILIETGAVREGGRFCFN